MKRSVEVMIHGQSFRLRTEANDAYVRDLAGHVDNVMQRVNRGSSSLAMDRLAIMAALQITDSMFQMEQQSEKDKQISVSIDERITRLIDHCDTLLFESK
ncbi:MAG: cell division protein ZapA [Magnetococcales bacterium]|nr:cell division protein ZapA [Magnetococcales bacterium]